MLAHRQMDMLRWPAEATKRKSSQAYSYPNKKAGFIIWNEREFYVTSVFVAVVFFIIYLFIEDDDDDNDNEEDIEEEGEVSDEDMNAEDDIDEEEKSDEEEDEEGDDEDEEAHADLLKVAVDCFIAVKAWVQLELGPGNANIEEILGMLRFIPGYDDAAKAK